MARKNPGLYCISVCKWRNWLQVPVRVEACGGDRGEAEGEDRGEGGWQDRGQCSHHRRGHQVATLVFYWPLFFLGFVLSSKLVVVLLKRFYQILFCFNAQLFWHLLFPMLELCWCVTLWGFFVLSWIFLLHPMLCVDIWYIFLLYYAVLQLSAKCKQKNWNYK